MNESPPASSVRKVLSLPSSGGLLSVMKALSDTISSEPSDLLTYSAKDRLGRFSSKGSPSSHAASSSDLVFVESISAYSRTSSRRASVCAFTAYTEKPAISEPKIRIMNARLKNAKLKQRFLMSLSGFNITLSPSTYSRSPLLS